MNLDLFLGEELYENEYQFLQYGIILTSIILYTQIYKETNVDLYIWEPKF